MLQELQYGFSSTLPLILIHDAGGTIYSYYSLGGLDRNVYAIANPRFENGKPWTGGVMEMAQTYYKFIKSRWPKGDILLGGWSLGGIIALQTSWILARDPNIRVRGIVMIDAPYPYEYGAGDTIVMPPMPPGMSTRLQSSLERAVRESIDMLHIWKMPKWPSRYGTPPLGITLRASRCVQCSQAGSIAMVDKFRSDSALGWNSCGLVRLKEMIEVDGDHFSIFDSDNVNSLTNALRHACDTLDVLSRIDDDSD